MAGVRVPCCFGAVPPGYLKDFRLKFTHCKIGNGVTIMTGAIVACSNLLPSLQDLKAVFMPPNIM